MTELSSVQEIRIKAASKHLLTDLLAFLADPTTGMHVGGMIEDTLYRYEADRRDEDGRAWLVCMALSAISGAVVTALILSVLA